jgi:hypothetical protein
LTEAKILLKNWMNIDYGEVGAEFHYSFINKKIFAEEYIGKKLENYKFLCYNGKPKYVYVSIKEGEQKYRNFYDMNWTFINELTFAPMNSFFYCKNKEDEIELAKDIIIKN